MSEHETKELVTRPADSLRITRLDSVQRKRFRWLRPTMFPMDKLSVLAGDGGEGKSTVMYDTIARVTTGNDFPEGPTGLAGPRNAVIVNTEDANDDTIVPRLEAAGADLSRIVTIDGHKTTGRFSLSQLPELEDLITRENAAIVVIDPVQSYMGGADTNSQTHVRNYLDPLADLAQRCSVAVVIVMHFNKSTGGKLMHRMSGSAGGFGGAVRAAIAAVEHPEKPNHFILGASKHNNSAKTNGWIYRIEAIEVGDDAEGEPVEATRVVWVGESDISAQEADNRHAQAARPPKEIERAKKLISEVLADGRSVPSTKLEDIADRKGISPRTLKRARRELGVKSRNSQEGWYVSLPGTLGSLGQVLDDEDGR